MCSLHFAKARCHTESCGFVRKACFVGLWTVVIASRCAQLALHFPDSIRRIRVLRACGVARPDWTQQDNWRVRRLVSTMAFDLACVLSSADSQLSTFIHILQFVMLIGARFTPGPQFPSDAKPFWSASKSCRVRQELGKVAPRDR